MRKKKTDLLPLGLLTKKENYIWFLLSEIAKFALFLPEIKVEKKGESMNKIKKIKTIPRFKNEDEEREFWATHDLADYFDHFQPVELDLSELRPSTKSVTIRLPESLLEALKSLAHKQDVPYQSLMKIFLAEKVKKEYQTS